MPWFWGCTDKQGMDEQARDRASKLAIEADTKLEKYLDYYVGLTKPGFAVLVTGAWGAGKTYQVKKALPDTHAHYISLFGLNSIEAIENQVFSKNNPIQSSVRERANALPNLGVSLPGIVSVSVNGPNGLVNAFIRNKVNDEKPFIFDDLERCSVPYKDILGLLNLYVEHHGCRVIVIAHDGKLIEDFKEIKEKIFGQTLRVEPDVDAAFSAFCSSLEGRAGKDRLAPLQNEVLLIFKESKEGSLRILRHVLEDVLRLLNTLEERHLEKQAAMIELVRLFSALAIEVRSGRLSKADLQERDRQNLAYLIDKKSEQYFSYSPKRTKKQTISPFVKEARKYFSVKLNSQLLNDQALLEILFDGYFSPETIHNSVNSSHYFRNEKPLKAWVVAREYYKRDDAEVEDAVQKINDQFDRREITISGELLHIVALKMMMASNRITTETLERVKRDARVYIDDLLTKEKAAKKEFSLKPIEGLDTSSFGGFSYVCSSPDFTEIIKYLNQAIIRADEVKFNEECGSLIETIESGEVFFNMFHSSRVREKFSQKPVLQFLPVIRFVDIWLSSPKVEWEYFVETLKERYSLNRERESFSPEIEWYSQLVLELTKRAESETGFSRLRIQRVINSMKIPVEECEEE